MQSKEKNMDLTSTENEAAKKAKKADKWADKPAMEVRDLHFAYGKNKVWSRKMRLNHSSLPCRA